MVVFEMGFDIGAIWVAFVEQRERYEVLAKPLEREFGTGDRGSVRGRCFWAIVVSPTRC